MIGEEALQGRFLFWEELIGMSAKSGSISAVVFDLGRNLAHQVHEVLLDHTNDVEAIRNDLRIREVFANQGAVGAAQIHADDADVFLSL